MFKLMLFVLCPCPWSIVSNVIDRSTVADQDGDIEIRSDNSTSTQVGRVKRFAYDNPTLKEGEFPPKLGKEIDQFVYRMHFTYSKNDAEALELRCSNKLTDEIFKTFPQATYRWTFNNKQFALDPARMMFMNGILVFQAVFAEDTGMYVCGIEYFPKKIKYVAFYSLLVSIPDPTIRRQATKPVELHCPSQFVAKIHSHSFRSWLLNGTVYKKLHKIPAQKKGPDIIPYLLVNMSGAWTCDVREPMNGKVWTVSFLNLMVDLEPPAWQKLVDVVRKNIIVIATISGAALLVITTGLLFCVYQTAKQESEQDLAIDALKTQMVDVKTQGIELEDDSLLDDTDFSDSGSDSD